MTDTHSARSTVEVPIDPATAFVVFTEEIDCWWVQGPINFHDTTRAHAKRIEPGVGGRVLEVYDPDTGDGLELGVVTVWEPGRRLAWRSSIDDVAVDVSFEVAADGTATTVEVTATIPVGGRDEGSTSWVRMTPPWFGDWVARRGDVVHEPERLARVGVALGYDRPATAARWLRDVFGFPLPIEPPDAADDPAQAEQVWIEFHVGGSLVMVFARSGEAAAREPVVTPWVFVDDLDAHYARVQEGGAPILKEIWHHGVRAFDAADLEGNRWTFAQASPIMRGS